MKEHIELTLITVMVFAIGVTSVLLLDRVLEVVR